MTEINLIAQDTTRYGEDRYGMRMLPELLQKICQIDGFRWIRVLYCYPERITDELLEVMAREERLSNTSTCPFSMPWQVLSAMNRQGDAQSLKALLQKIRAKCRAW